MGKPKAGVTNEQRFWAAVEQTDGCWIWRAHRNVQGYGRIVWYGKRVLAHRVSFELANGPIPVGMFVLHHCDNPPCVNPTHLYAGTKADNARDAIARGRWPHRPSLRGAESPSAKLTAEQADAIRLLKPRGQDALRMAARLAVNVATIERIRRGQTYRKEAA